MGADADGRPVGACRGVWHGWLFSEHGHQEIVRQMRMAAAMTAALQEREMVGVLNGSRLGEFSNRFGEQVREIGDRDPLGNVQFGERMFRRTLGVDDGIFSLDLLPLEALLAAGGVEALAIL